MIARDHPVARPVRSMDRQQINNLANNGSFIHRHLDWRSPVEWIGYQPYWVLESQNQLKAALACPLDIENVAWIRLFALRSGLTVQEAWGPLWAAIQTELSQLSVDIAVIPTQRWYQEFLLTEGFTPINEVVTLAWAPPSKHIARLPANIKIRSMAPSDLISVQRLDATAFSPLWIISFDLLETAWSMAAIATVAEDENGIIGYQISTANYSGGHLARLAVHPDRQGQGIGRDLVLDIFSQFERWGTERVTVNTQADNIASLALYEKIGFNRTTEVYPVYQA
jgi:ribosomal protein S18 acetylase RimI-like enzyme